MSSPPRVTAVTLRRKRCARMVDRSMAEVTRLQEKQNNSVCCKRGVTGVMLSASIRVYLLRNIRGCLWPAMK